MRVIPVFLLYWLAALLLCFAGASFASTVYRTVDEDGVVNFSDTPPEGAAEVETLQISTPEPRQSEEDAQRLEDMRETTDRMAADRREREKHRAEMRQLQGSAANTPNTTYSDYMPASSSFYSGYSGYYGSPIYRPGRPGRPHRPNRPGYRPRPEHPIVRPPLRPNPRPEAQINRGSNQQLMRPIVSPRR